MWATLGVNLISPQQKQGGQQGLTQTFLGSGPQDHQLRESGGPTIFLVVLRIKSLHTNSYAYIIKK